MKEHLETDTKMRSSIEAVELNTISTTSYGREQCFWRWQQEGRHHSILKNAVHIFCYINDKVGTMTRSSTPDVREIRKRIFYPQAKRSQIHVHN
jgi:hypothetical protein